MAVKKHGVHFDITAENATDRALRAVESNLNGVNRAAEKVGRVLQGAFIATAAISAGKAFADAAMQAEQASKRLDAVLKATGHSAGLTKDQLDGMADAMAESTQFDDESLRNAQAQLLKFGNIHGETFKEALKLSADLAAFMGTDLGTAAQAVGKALTSPTEGLGALERQVGKFNPAAQAMIKNLADTGQEARAQSAVLDILKGKIGGTAEMMNTGITKSVNDLKKAFDELNEASGKKGGPSVAGALDMITERAERLKEIIENGTWFEKVMALMAFSSLPANIAGIKPGLTPTPPKWEPKLRPFNEVQAERAAREFDYGHTMPEWAGREKFLKDFRDSEKKKRDEAKKLQDERMREAEKMAEAQVDLEEMAAQDSREAWDHWGKIQQEDERKRIEGQAQMWRDVFEQIDQEQEDAIEAGKILLDGLEAEAKSASDAARELGMTFVSAFEDAIIEGKKFSDVLKGLGQDIARIILRKSITEPLGKAVGDWASGSDIGKGIGDWIGGLFKAEGGPVMAGAPYIVGERGPELFVPGGSGSIVPHGEFGSGGGSGGPRIVVGSIDMRGASVEAVARLERLFSQLNASIEGRALGAMRAAAVRGM